MQMRLGKYCLRHLAKWQQLVAYQGVPRHTKTIDISIALLKEKTIFPLQIANDASAQVVEIATEKSLHLHVIRSSGDFRLTEK